MTFRSTAALCALMTAGAASAHGGAGTLPVPAELSVAAAPADGATDLKFAEMIRMPIGPRGLEPSAKLTALDGRRVRLVGYMASAEAPMAGRLVLTPLPVELGDEDESLSDDLPANAVFVHLSADQAQRTLPNLRGLLQLSGTLRLGAEDEPDGHVSSIRLLLDEAASRRLVGATERAMSALSPMRNPEPGVPK